MHMVGYRNTRYKGRQKQSTKLHMMFVLANLFLADKRFGLIERFETHAFASKY